MPGSNSNNSHEEEDEEIRNLTERLKQINKDFDEGKNPPITKNGKPIIEVTKRKKGGKKKTRIMKLKKSKKSRKSRKSRKSKK